MRAHIHRTRNRGFAGLSTHRAHNLSIGLWQAVQPAPARREGVSCTGLVHHGGLCVVAGVSRRCLAGLHIDRTLVSALTAHSVGCC